MRRVERKGKYVVFTAILDGTYPNRQITETRNDQSALFVERASLASPRVPSTAHAKWLHQSFEEFPCISVYTPSLAVTTGLIAEFARVNWLESFALRKCSGNLTGRHLLKDLRVDGRVILKYVNDMWNSWKSGRVYDVPQYGAWNSSCSYLSGWINSGAVGTACRHSRCVFKEVFLNGGLYRSVTCRWEERRYSEVGLRIDRTAVRSLFESMPALEYVLVKHIFALISGFHRGVNEVVPPMGCYAAYIGT
jgi:hypothetical protein